MIVDCKCRMDCGYERRIKIEGGVHELGETCPDCGGDLEISIDFGETE